MKWPKKKFHFAAEDVTGGNFKVQKKDYLNQGKVPVVDQGQSLLAGYSNDLEKKFSGNLPVVIFGDHTRVLKYIDFPFAIGADGVKVLTTKGSLNAKFFYYFLKSLEIPNFGYSRHFKFLKNVDVPYPAPSEQRQIVEILDQADQLRKLRAEADKKAESILPALFNKLFGDPNTNPMNWAKEPLADHVEIGTRLIDPNDSEFAGLPHIGAEHIEKNSGKILDYVTTDESNLRSNKFTFSESHVLYSKIRPYLNKVTFPQFKGVCSADVYPLLPKKPKISAWYLVCLLRSNAFLAYAQTHSDRLRIPKLNKDQLGAYPLPLPNANLIRQFDAQAEIIDKMQTKRHSAGIQIESMFSTLLQRAFSGTLTASWREAHMKEVLAEMDQQAKYLN